MSSESERNSLNQNPNLERELVIGLHDGSREMPDSRMRLSPDGIEFGVDFNVDGDGRFGGDLEVGGTLEVHGDLIVRGRIIEEGEIQKSTEEKKPQRRKKFERFKKIRGT